MALAKSSSALLFLPEQKLRRTIIVNIHTICLNLNLLGLDDNTKKKKIQEYYSKTMKIRSTTSKR